MTPHDKLLDLIRSRFGNSQAKFAAAIKRSPSQVNQWVNGYRNIDVKAGRHIERELNLPVDYFFSDANPEQNYPTAQPQQTPCATEPANVAIFPTNSFSPTVMEIAKIAETMSRDGQMMLLGQAQLLAGQHPRDKANTAK